MTGNAVPRTTPPPGSVYGAYGYYSPYYYDPYGFYGYYGFGGGYYGYYNPYYSPYGFGGYGLDPGFGVPYYGDPTDPYSYGEGYGTYSTRVYNGEGQGALKLKVKPRNAKVYVDGYFVGQVDQFDGMRKKLTLNAGSHKVEIKADGYETAEFDVLITPDKTLTFEGDLKKLM
jgi:hypothetical protein